DELRIQSNIETINSLLKKKNIIICMSKVGRPKGRDRSLSLSRMLPFLPHYFPEIKWTFIKDHTKVTREDFEYKPNHIYLLENLRFYPEEKTGDNGYTKQLASLGEIYVNNCFSMCHRDEVSITGLPKFLPSYAGLALKKEIASFYALTNHTSHPFVVVIGGTKLETKLQILYKLIDKADTLLLGGVMANTFLAATGHDMKKSAYEKDMVDKAKKILSYALISGKKIHVPIDLIEEKDVALDIGPNTMELYRQIISQARTILYNGPMGYYQNPSFAKGTQMIGKAIVDAKSAYSVVCGGDTISALSGLKNIDKIDHISTGGGAYLTYIEKERLIGIDALISSSKI
ncbi:MAG: phosphoglycerate kinase, partial [Candidatus Roizmanbacteria bacterium]